MVNKADEFRGMIGKEISFISHKLFFHSSILWTIPSKAANFLDVSPCLMYTCNKNELGPRNKKRKYQRRYFRMNELRKNGCSGIAR